jgi:Fe-S-cluster formation regulator IscX/YfhJ
MCVCYNIAQPKETYLKPRNYLNNKDILKEIHKSKATYCSYVDKERDHQYDIIVKDITAIKGRHETLEDGTYITTIAQAKTNRAKRLGGAEFVKHKADGGKLKQAEFAIDPKTINKTDLVFRVMAFEHIPDEPGRKKKPKTIADTKVKLSFPPFQHFRFNAEGELVCVCKSHWIGEVDSGKFAKEKGQATNELAKMWIKLCERYATRGNVRGYSYNDEMRGQAITQLAQIGLQFDESKSDNPFAYYTQTVTNSFVRVINVEKRAQDLRDDLLEIEGLNPSYTRQNKGQWETALEKHNEEFNNSDD